MLLEEELRLKTREGREDSAFLSRTKGKGTSNSNNVNRIPKKKFNGSCFYCDKKGHTIKDFRKKVADEKNGSSKTRPSHVHTMAFTIGPYPHSTFPSTSELYVVVRESLTPS